MASLLDLPNELTLSILSEINTIPEEKQRTLKSFSLTCRRFLPFAQDVLLASPCVNINLLHHLADAYCRNESSLSQGRRVTTLEIRSHKQHGCACTRNTGILAIAALEGLRRLLHILPNMHTLLLGANRIQDIVPLHHIFWGDEYIFCTHHGWCKPSKPNPIAGLKIQDYPNLAQRLTTIEFPADWTQLWNGKKQYCLPHRESWALCDYERLTKITVPGRALASVVESIEFPFAFPENLTHLVVSNVSLWDALSYLEFSKDSEHVSNLSKIEIWAREEHAGGRFWGVDRHLIGCTIPRARKDWMAKGVVLDFRYDTCPSQHVRENMLRKERHGRQIIEVQCFAFEARGHFRDARAGAGEESFIAAREHAEWITRHRLTGVEAITDMGDEQDEDSEDESGEESEDENSEDSDDEFVEDSGDESYADTDSEWDGTSEDESDEDSEEEMDEGDGHEPGPRGPLSSQLATLFKRYR